MPAFCTHYLFFKDLQDRIKSEFNFELNEAAASIGTQGPDIFFFHRAIPFFMPGRPGRKIGSQLHRSKAEDIFGAFKEYLEISEKRDIAKSYMYGFIMHYALDRNCHPYVYAYVNKIQEENRFIHHNSAHNRVEMGMDAYLLHLKRNIENTRLFDTAETIIASEDVIDEISTLMSFTVKRITGKDIGKRKIKQAIKDTQAMQGLLRDKYGILTSICRVLETVTAPIIRYFKFSSMIKPKGWKNSLKYANIEKSEWRSPYDSERERFESFTELYEYSQKDAVMLIYGFEEFLKGNADAKQITNNISFLTGTEVI